MHLAQTPHGRGAFHRASPTSRFSLPRWIARKAMTLLTLLQTWQERRGQRIALSRLNDGMLRDIGLSRVDAARESDKPFWQP